MEPLNIFLLSKANDLNAFKNLHKHLSHLKFKINQEEHEFESLKSLVNKVSEFGLNLFDYDGFFYSYRIPQIGKEFDLLKFNNDECLNIELKIKMTSENKIKNQLIKNRYYLNSLNKTTDLFTYVAKENLCYTIDEEENLIKCRVDDLVLKMKRFNGNYITNIESLFRVKNYLVSPINTPDLFINNKYFLTSQQSDIKRDILKSIITRPFYKFVSIKGSPGTGKTLLVYDIAKELVNSENEVLIVHCGIKSDGHIYLDNYYSNLKIVVPKNINEDFSFESYDIIIVDEVQRIYTKQYNLICDAVIKSGKVCLFASDKHQILSQAESRRKIWEKIEKISDIETYKLSEKIRTNMEMAAFIRKVRNLNTNEVFDSKNIEVVFAQSQPEAKSILEYYEEKGYTFINFSRSNYNYSPYSAYDFNYDTHQVIGQEFDDVVMILDNSFYYDRNNILSAIPHPNPDYLYTQLFYQGITRVRERLSLIVVDNAELFDKIISVF